jgi:hypothetical protein
MVIFPHSRHALSASIDKMMAVYIDITAVFHVSGLQHEPVSLWLHPVSASL